jgi:hypothetical protein
MNTARREHPGQQTATHLYRYRRIESILHFHNLKVVRTPDGALEVKGKRLRPRGAMTTHRSNRVILRRLYI